MAAKQKITPFLWFDDNAEEAVNFYLSVFKVGKIIDVSRYSEAGRGKPGSVMVMEFEIEGQRFSALNGGPIFKFNEAISLSVSCESQTEVDDLWAKLTADGGAESQCGWLKDKYGLSWQIVPSALSRVFKGPDKAGVKRAMEAMFQMKKLDVAALERAYAGK
ncbi:MAG: VOC family protein [Hyphomicrobium sp.]|nr:VOC family protein [Hyphomicrobium sp.]